MCMPPPKYRPLHTAAMFSASSCASPSSTVSRTRVTLYLKRVTNSAQENANRPEIRFVSHAPLTASTTRPDSPRLAMLMK